MQTEFDPTPGIAEQLDPGLTRILAPNPSPMTFMGTNTYLLGDARLTIVDPGPESSEHLSAILAAIKGRPVDQIIVTHSHLDHSPLARPLAGETGAKILAFGDSNAGQSPVMQQLAAQGLAGGGEGVDVNFEFDQRVNDGEIIDAECPIRVIHTPGHMGNHISLSWQDVVLTGDHVMGWASSLVSPPDGDLTDFMQSCAKLQSIPARRYHAGHGAPMDDPHGRLAELIQHRKSREQQILQALSTGCTTASEVTQTVYTDVNPRLFPAAERNVFAHLVDLVGRDVITAQPQISINARFELRR